MSESLNMSQISALAEELDRAACSACAVLQLSLLNQLSVDDAYRIQRASIQRRVDRGEQVVGVKMGFTSQAKMAQMGVSDQILGQLTSGMETKDGATISLNAFIHPRGEPEIAFWLKKDLGADASLEEAFDAISYVAPAIEIFDSRYKQFQFSLADVIADNASAAAFVLGKWVKPPNDLASLSVELTINGEVRQRGSTRDILGHPLFALVSAARLRALQGCPLKQGSIVLAGAATLAEPIESGMHILARIVGLGEVQFSVVPEQ